LTNWRDIIFAIGRWGVRFGAAGVLISGAAFADPTPEDTHLIGVSLGSPLSSVPGRARSMGFELSGGGRIGFDDWYQVRIPDLRFEFLTELTPDLGLIWGIGTGEYGEKYRIEPSLKVGLLHTRPIGDAGLLSIQLTTRIGGRLRERSCDADYGLIGGVQRVNCRLAATPLEPNETLDHLWDEGPTDRLEGAIRLTFRF